MGGAAVVLFVVGVVLAPGCKKNHAPDTPRVPSGPSAGLVDSSYSFWTTSEGPVGGSVCYRFDWGNGDTSEWGPFIAFGETSTMSHSWSSAGTLDVRAQSRGYDGVTSTWSDGHTLVVFFTDKTFGGAGYDFGYSVQQTQDGGYIIAGYTDSYGAGAYDARLIKTNAGGDTVWTKTFGGTDNDGSNSVQQTSDGGYIVTGVTSSDGACGDDIWLIKTDPEGNMVWDKTYGGASGDRGYSVQQTRDGGYIIVGFTESFGAGGRDIWLIKTDVIGDTTWTRTFGGVAGDVGLSVQQTPDGGCIVSGATGSYGAGGGDVWLIKTDANGDTVWTKTFGGADNDFGYSVQQTQDGGYIIAGWTESFGAGGYDVWLIKTDAAGSTVWSKTYGGTGLDYGYSVQQTADGGYIIAGSTDSYGAGRLDVWLVKTDVNGDTAWTRTFGGSSDDEALSVQQTQDGGYIVTGYTSSYGAGEDDVWLIKTDAEGRFEPGFRSGGR